MFACFATLCLTGSGSIELEDNIGGLAGCGLVVETNTGSKDTGRLGVLERIFRRINIEINTGWWMLEGRLLAG